MPQEHTTDELTIDKRYEIAKQHQNQFKNQKIDQQSESDDSNLSKSYIEFHQEKTESIVQQIEMLPQRAKVIKFKQNQSFNFCVYMGNFPQVVRDVMALRRNENGSKIWTEAEPVTDNICEIDFVWKPVNFQRSHGFDMMGKRCATQVDRPFGYCHYEFISILSSKTGLVKTLQHYYSKNPQFRKSRYTYDMSMGMSFLLPGADYLGSEDTAKVRKLFVKFEKKNLCGEKLSARQCQRNMWILKPENENRGRGIELVGSYKELIQKMCGKIQGENFIIQKYIERPLLYYGRKFDIRVLALIDGDKNFFLYKPCYLRTSSNNYTLNDQSKFIHLTNNCFQMKSDNYQQHEAGNQIPYEVFLEYLDKYYGEELKDLDKDHITQRMKDIMIDCHAAALPQIDARRRPGLKLEIVGFDFILDEDLRVWLIEVNTCPFMGPVLTQQHPSFMLDLLDDTFKLTVDKVFHGRTLTPEEISQDTQYELLCNHDLSFNQRSRIGIDPPDSSDENLFPELPRSLYPSQLAYERLIRSQTKHLRRWRKQKLEEFKQQQKMMKVRNKRFLQLGGDPNALVGAPVRGPQGITSNQVLAIKNQEVKNIINRPKNANDKFTAQRMSAKPPVNHNKGQKISDNHIMQIDMEAPSQEQMETQNQKNLNRESKNLVVQSRARSEIVEKVLKNSSSKVLTKSRAKLPVDARLAESKQKQPPAISGRETPRGENNEQQKIRIDPSQAVFDQNLLKKPKERTSSPTGQSQNINRTSVQRDQVFNALRNFMNVYNRSSGGVNGSQQPDEIRKQFRKIINLSIKLMHKVDQKSALQGAEVFKTLLHSQFVLFLQDEDIISTIFKLLEPENAFQDKEIEEIVHQTILELFKQPANHSIRDVILSSPTLYGTMLSQVLDSISLGDTDESNIHLQIFLVTCSVLNESGSTQKQNRKVYIPGETQEQRKLKRKSVQNGSIMFAHLIQQRCPSLSVYMRSQYLRHLDWQDQLGHFMSLIHFFEKTHVSQLPSVQASSSISVQSSVVHSMETPNKKSSNMITPKKSLCMNRQTQNNSGLKFKGNFQEIGQDFQSKQFESLKEFVETEILTSSKYLLAKVEAEKVSKKVSKLFVQFENSYPECLISNVINAADEDQVFLTSAYIDSQFKIVRNIIERKVGVKTTTASMNDERQILAENKTPMHEQQNLSATVDLIQSKYQQEGIVQKRTTFRGNLMNHIIRGSMGPVKDIDLKPPFVDDISVARNNGSIILDSIPCSSNQDQGNIKYYKPIDKSKCISGQSRGNSMAQRHLETFADHPNKIMKIVKPSKSSKSKKVQSQRQKSTMRNSRVLSHNPGTNQRSPCQNLSRQTSTGAQFNIEDNLQEAESYRMHDQIIDKYKGMEGAAQQWSNQAILHEGESTHDRMILVQGSSKKNVGSSHGSHNAVRLGDLKRGHQAIKTPQGGIGVLNLHDAQMMQNVHGEMSDRYYKSQGKSNMGNNSGQENQKHYETLKQAKRPRPNFPTNSNQAQPAPRQFKQGSNQKPKAGMKLNDGYKQALRILSQIQDNEKQLLENCSGQNNSMLHSTSGKNALSQHQHVNSKSIKSLKNIQTDIHMIGQ